MLKQLINFYKVSSPRPCNGEALSSSGSQHLHSDARRLKYLKWSTFLSATFGYGMYYVCRLSLNVVKKPIVDEGIFSETELGIIGSVLFFTYALGKDSISSNFLNNCIPHKVKFVVLKSFLLNGFCCTPAILIEVAAVPGRLESRIRLSELPSVVP